MAYNKSSESTVLLGSHTHHYIEIKRLSMSALRVQNKKIEMNKLVMFKRIKHKGVNFDFYKISPNNTAYHGLNVH